LEAKPTEKELQDDKDFEAWSDSLQARLESATLEKYMLRPHLKILTLTIRTYRAILQARLHSCNMILSQTSTLLSTLNTLKLGFSAVADQTSSIQAQCDALVKEEVHRLQSTLTTGTTISIRR
jgi:Sec34-like family